MLKGIIKKMTKFKKCGVCVCVCVCVISFLKADKSSLLRFGRQRQERSVSSLKQSFWILVLHCWWLLASA